MGAKEGQGWALGTAFMGCSERMFGDKVDLDSPWKEHISLSMLHLFLLKIPRSKMHKPCLTMDTEGGGSGVIYAILFLIHLVH